ncbi:hypothetical protein [Streptomyces sp. CBMA29]|uniref:hypothetical protein n=1 Tax=Streptomyces sp. CBMA29 TaxID=1896314 RepID=UPI001661B5CC|nr:hypothetical protein [Streptomyces sp. CBMA29]MBD0739868.1 hypothetical protein [Streptomyces sp. CBMA29]
MSKERAATAGLALPALIALGMSANTSYRYVGEHLGITVVTERGLLTGVAELAVVALVLHAWATKTKASLLFSYGLIALQAIPAFSVSGGGGGVMRVALGPVLAGVLLHFLLSLDALHAPKPDGFLNRVWAEIRDRIVSRLGLGARGADSAAIARSRATDKAVRLADELSRVTADRKAARLSVRLSKAVDAAQHGLEGAEAAKAEVRFVERLKRRKSVAGLAAIDGDHEWGVVPEGGEPALIFSVSGSAANSHWDPPLSSLPVSSAIRLVVSHQADMSHADVVQVLLENGVETNAAYVSSIRSKDKAKQAAPADLSPFRSASF